MDYKKLEQWKRMYFLKYVEDDSIKLIDANPLIGLLNKDYDFSSKTYEDLILVPVKDSDTKYIISNNKVYRLSVNLRFDKDSVEVDVISKLNPDISLETGNVYLYRYIGTVDELLNNSYVKLIQESHYNKSIVYFDSSFEYEQLFPSSYKIKTNTVSLKSIIKDYISSNCIFGSEEFFNKMGMSYDNTFMTYNIVFDKDSNIDIVDYINEVNKPLFNYIDHLNDCYKIVDKLTSELKELIYKYLNIQQKNYYLVEDSTFVIEDKDPILVESIGNFYVNENFEKLRVKSNPTKSDLKKLEKKFILQLKDCDLYYKKNGYLKPLSEHLYSLDYLSQIKILRNLVSDMRFKLVKVLTKPIKDIPIENCYKIHDIINTLKNHFVNNDEFWFVKEDNYVKVELKKSKYVFRNDITGLLKTEIESVLKDKFDLTNIYWNGNSFTKRFKGEFVFI